MPWLLPAVITTLIGSVLLSLTYWAFYSLYRKPYLLLWAASWSVYAFRYVFLFLLLEQGDNPYLYFGNLASIVVSLYLLYRGTVVFLERQMPPVWNLIFAAIFVWTAIGVFGDFSFLLLTIPLFGVMAWVNIWVGWIILRSDLPVGAGKTVVGATFIIWGLHRADFPFLRPVEWFAPIGYLIATVCAVTIAFGMILLFFKKMYMELGTRDAQLQKLFDDAIYGIALADPETGIIVNCNNAFARMLGRNKEQIVGHPHQEFYSPEESETGLNETFRKHLGEQLGQILESRMLNASGDFIDVEIQASLVEADDNCYLQAFFRDITERKRAEEQLRHHKNLLEKSQELGHIGSWEYDIENDRLLWTDEIHKIFCIPYGTDLNYGIFMRRVHPDDREEVARRWKAALEGASYDIEHRLLIGGETRWVRQKASLEYTYTDKPVRAIGFAQDITDLKQAEKERENLESQLRQVQKIESVGRLAGGVAHDYNNMLGVIIGYTELAQMKVDSNDPLHEDLEQVLAAARRSRDITRKLLAFARKQTLAPQILDLNQAVEDILKMLRDLLGEQIELVWEPQSQLWPVEIDPAQLDQVLTNLCINARDAIKDTGKMIIETGQVTFDQAYCDDNPGFKPGDYVVLTVSDNGCGMDRETLENIYEPFFTTKPLGAGTGLGLATVYGIVKQSNGYINVYSEPGQGATFKVYLPRCSSAAKAEKQRPQSEVPRGRGETILVVEDEYSVLKLTQTILEGLGYRVLAADSPSRAFTLAEAHEDVIHLLVTDVVMPKMNGRELADRLQLMYPGLRCLYMSGYTGNAIAHHGILDQGLHFIHKPFSRQDLGQQVNQVLNEKP